MVNWTFQGTIEPPDSGPSPTLPVLDSGIILETMLNPQTLSKFLGKELFKYFFWLIYEYVKNKSNLPYFTKFFMPIYYLGYLVIFLDI